MLLAGIASLALAATSTVATTTSAALAAPGELIANGTFDTDTAGWNAYPNPSAAGGQLCIAVPAGTVNPWDAQAAVEGLTLTAGETYTLTFDASAAPNTSPTLVVQSAALGYKQFLRAVPDAPVKPAFTTAMASFTYTFTPDASAADASLGFQLGGANAAGYTFCLDNVSLMGGAPAEQVVNGTFDTDSNGWDKSGFADTTTAGGTFCATVPGGTVNPWDVGLGQNTLNLTSGQNYLLEFDASATKNVTVRAVVGKATAPYTTYHEEAPALTPTTTHFRYVFTGPTTDAAAQLAFQIGGKSATPWTFCIDNVSFQPTTEQPKYVQETGPRVRVNQYGYLPKGPKNATLVTTSTPPVPFQLKDAAGAVVFSGTTKPVGLDATAGVNVHAIDFSAFDHVSGVGFTITADGETSYPFDIAVDIYEKLRVDAASYFYPVRSGIAIDGSIVGSEEYTRPAGHVSTPTTPVAGSANKGDRNVPCQSALNQGGMGAGNVYGATGAWTCPDGYTLDVVGGWYDAGDHGKYVVNGGISVAQLMQTYERNSYARTADKGAFADGTLRIVERGNGVPDILDEARWELEWMLSMQVPAGTTMTIGGSPVNVSGMVHHKIHDEGWTGLPLLPHVDPQVRSLHRPSTAATLNLAAAAAQGARVFAKIDPAFSAKLLAAAKTAYAAAKANPAIFATGADGGAGGGAYDDSNVADEFFWAAAELYITTGSIALRADVVNPPLYRQPISANGINNSAVGFDWGHPAALAWIDLAELAREPHIRKTAKERIVTVAKAIVAVQQVSPWGLMYAPSNNVFDWGSNSLGANNMVLVGAAFDLTNKKVYRDAVLESLDYLLGRNALNNSYVTGYGKQFSDDQHNRWFSNSLNSDLPNPPVGSLAGGPNSVVGTWDPTWAAANSRLEGGSCVDRPQVCYIDNINSWSTNEIAVNWNSALTWVAAFAADQDKG